MASNTTATCPKPFLQEDFYTRDGCKLLAAASSMRPKQPLLTPRFRCGGETVPTFRGRDLLPAMSHDGLGVSGQLPDHECGSELGGGRQHDMLRLSVALMGRAAR
jgi:hypothetical protein